MKAFRALQANLCAVGGEKLAAAQRGSMTTPSKLYAGLFLALGLSQRQPLTAPGEAAQSPVATRSQALLSGLRRVALSGGGACRLAF